MKIVTSQQQAIHVPVVVRACPVAARLRVGLEQLLADVLEFVMQLGDLTQEHADFASIGLGAIAGRRGVMKASGGKAGAKNVKRLLGERVG